MTTTGKNRIMIFGPKTDGTYVVEFRTAAGEARGGGAGDASTCRLLTRLPSRRTMPGVLRSVPAILRGDTMVHRPTMLRARDTTTTTRSTQSLGDLALLTVGTSGAPVSWAKRSPRNISLSPLYKGSRDPVLAPHTLGRGSRFGERQTTGQGGAPMSTIAAAAGIADRIDYWIRQHVIPYGIKAVRTVTESKNVESPRPPVRQPGGAFPT
jgi:hypothetical protein